jgi:predicted secreted hydrolase
MELAKEVINISRKHICYIQLAITIGASYPVFLHSQRREDDLEMQSRFRMEWWRKARSGDLEIGTFSSIFTTQGGR